MGKGWRATLHRGAGLLSRAARSKCGASPAAAALQRGTQSALASPCNGGVLPSDSIWLPQFFPWNGGQQRPCRATPARPTLPAWSAPAPAPAHRSWMAEAPRYLLGSADPVPRNSTSGPPRAPLPPPLPPAPAPPDASCCRQAGAPSSHAGRRCPALASGWHPSRCCPPSSACSCAGCCSGCRSASSGCCAAAAGPPAAADCCRERLLPCNRALSPSAARLLLAAETAAADSTCCSADAGPGAGWLGANGAGCSGGCTSSACE